MYSEPGSFIPIADHLRGGRVISWWELGASSTEWSRCINQRKPVLRPLRIHTLVQAHAHGIVLLQSTVEYALHCPYNHLPSSLHQHMINRKKKIPDFIDENRVKKMNMIRPSKVSHQTYHKIIMRNFLDNNWKFTRFASTWDKETHFLNNIPCFRHGKGNGSMGHGIPCVPTGSLMRPRRPHFVHTSTGCNTNSKEFS